MKIEEKGVLETSDVYFHAASETARRLYFYILCTGRYQCDGQYAVNRNRYDSFLLLYVVKGTGYAYIANRRYELSDGNLALLDCYQPNRYGAYSHWDILWIHFDGVLARAYYDTIADNHSLCLSLPNPYSVMRSMEKIFRMYHHEKRTSEPLVSRYIVNVLTEMLISDEAGEGESANHLDELLTYITQNLDKPLTLEQLAKRVSMSPFYFSRQFKKEFGCAPHAYLVSARVDAAKFYLKNTPLSNKEIAYRCGMSSESSFCTTFKRLTGTSPQAYRNGTGPGA